MKRRSFLKGIGTAGLVLWSSPLSPLKAVAGKEPVYAMIIDLERCMGCQTCIVACQIEKGDLSGGFNATVRYTEKGTYPVARQYFVPLQCNQCQDPLCMAACDSGAIKQLDSGIIFTDWNVCNGSGACVEACPFGMRHMVILEGQVKSAKCDFCLQRLHQNKEPVCVATCPSRARLFGDLTRPKGEFALYLKKKFIFQLSTSKGQRGHVFYAGDRALARLCLKRSG